MLLKRDAWAVHRPLPAKLGSCAANLVTRQETCESRALTDTPYSRRIGIPVTASVCRCSAPQAARLDGELMVGRPRPISEVLHSPRLDQGRSPGVEHGKRCRGR